MNISKTIFRFLLVIILGCGCLLAFFHFKVAEGAPAQVAPSSPAQVPAIIQTGFSAWAKNRNASWAFDTWKIGGLMERDTKPGILSRYFFQFDQTLGSYQSYELIQTKRISQNSSVIYVAVNFAHAVVYGRFMMYRTDKDWVVQNMDFSPRPEAMMPWLAFEGETYGQ